MKREEAIKGLEKLRTQYATAAEIGPTREYRLLFKDAADVLDAALAAFRSPTREQVEKMWRGEWKTLGAAKHGKPGVHYCTKCEECHPYKYNFCPDCGSPMTDEAVEITLQRLEALHENDR